MSDEIDSAAGTVSDHVAAAALGATVRPSRPAALEPDTPPGVCANCTVTLQGPVCHICGQIDDTYHRSIGALIGQMLEGFFNLDGRVARTVPMLLLRPGRITHTYLKGARARFIPPFRLYIIASLIFFLIAGFAAGDLVFSPAAVDTRTIEEARSDIQRQVETGELTREEADNALSALDLIDRTAAPLRLGSQTAPPADAGTADPAVSGADSVEAGSSGGIEAFLERQAERVAADPGRWADATQAWVPRIMFLLVPVYAGLIALTYLWRRGFFYYDHLIASVHLHAALFLAMAAGILVSPLIGAGWVVALLVVYSNIYVYRLHRVVYSRSRITSVLRTVVLDVAYLFVMLIALLGVVIIGFVSV